MDEQESERGTEELEDEASFEPPDREATSLAGFGDEIVDLNFDHRYLPPEVDGYEPPPDNAA
jgi:hypothetical protein